jgi:hypothetical protein
MTALCADPAGCVHEWAGVPNRAATLIVDGGVPGSNHPGIGRPTAAVLYLAMLTGGNAASTDLFLDERLNLVATCNALVANSTVVAGRQMAQADCDHIAKAFDTVGVVAPIEMGWTRFSSGLFGNKTDVITRQGQLLYRGCTMANQILRGEDDSGEMKTSDIASGLVIDFNGEWGASVTARGSATSPVDRSVSYHIWTNWFNAGVVDVDEVYSKPAGISDDQCRTPNNSVNRVSFWSTQTANSWATFFDGHKGDLVVNAATVMPPGCELESVRGIHYHTWGVPEGAPAYALNHEGRHGFTVDRLAVNPAELVANLHWWHEGISSIKARVQYDVFQPVGTNCLVSGLQTTP